MMNSYLLYLVSLILIVRKVYAIEIVTETGGKVTPKTKENIHVPLKARLQKIITKEWHSYVVVEHWTFEHVPLQNSIDEGATGTDKTSSTPVLSMIKPQYITSTYLSNPIFAEHIHSGTVYSIPFQVPESAKKLTVKDALGWISTFARIGNIVRVQPRYPFANGWKGEIIIKYVVKDVKEALDGKMPFDGLNVETELIDGGDTTNYRWLLLFPFIMPLIYWKLNDVGKSDVQYNKERNKLLLAVREVSDLDALRENEFTDDVALQGLYEKQLDMIKMLLQSTDLKRKKQLQKELMTLDEEILGIECDY